MLNDQVASPGKAANQVQVGDVIVVNKEPMEVQKTEFTKFCCSGGILIHLWLKGLKSGRETLSTLKPDEPVEEHHGP